LKVNTRICKRFSTNSEHKTLLFSIKDDLHNTKILFEKQFTSLQGDILFISAVLCGTIGVIIGVNI